ncbi:MAG TPA: hypothetical protein DEP66_05550 [Acidimicrobiaceae bacterium]|nr:hypothetical protein [Acidimicrobiaceae bacterium]HCB37659.1 hypothetical protein [Acidimicrobiaceae bacterium]
MSAIPSAARGGPGGPGGPDGASADLTARFEFDHRLAGGRSLGRTGGKGPVGSVVYDGPVVWRALDTAAGTATLRIERAGHTALVAAWGDGAEAATARVPALLGADDDPAPLRPHHRVVAQWMRRWSHWRLSRTGSVWEHIVPVVCGQKVPGAGAKRSWQGIIRRWGRPAPGPAPADLALVPTAETLGALAYHDFHRFDVERRRAETIIGAARRAAGLERAAAMEPAQARRLLQTVVGIGPWTASIVVLLCHGDPDSVVVGDYQIPNYVAWHLAGERTGDDDRMLELLAPYAGQRSRVQGFAKAAGAPPRHGARMPLPDLRGR